MMIIIDNFLYTHEKKRKEKERFSIKCPSKINYLLIEINGNIFKAFTSYGN